MRRLARVLRVDSHSCSYVRRLMGRKRSVGPIAIILLFLLSPAASAADLYWDNVSGSTFPFYTDLTWWSTDAALSIPAVAAPVASDNIFFLYDGIPYTVLLSTGNQATNISASNGDVTLTSAPGGTLASSGLVTIDDPFAAGLADGAKVTLNTSSWTSAADVLVADVGFGSLTINGSADMTGRQFFVGNSAGAEGQLTLTGAGTTLTASLGSNTGVYTIGRAGGTGTVNVLDGARMLTASTGANDIWVGGHSDDQGINPAVYSTGTLNVDGVDSFVETEDLNVGIFGGTGYLNITNGGQVVLTDGGTNGSPDAGFGVNDGADGAKPTGTGVVDGDGSLLQGRSLNVGVSGSGRLEVRAGGEARTRTQGTSAGDMIIGVNAGSDGKAAVQGMGSATSLLDVDESLYVGDDGLGVLYIGRDIDNNAVGSGALQVDVDLRIGDNTTNTESNLVILDGAATTANVGGVAYVGLSGKGRLEVLNGATLTGADLRVAQNSTSTGGDMTVQNGSAAAFTNSAAIGNDATGTLLIDTGSTMTVEDVLWVGYDNGEGTVTIRDAGSELRVNTANGADVYIGGENDQTGGTGTVNVESGGLFTTQRQVYIGGNSTGSGTVNVTGPGSTALFYDNNALTDAANEVTYVGYNGAGKLNITDGGFVRNEIVRFGEGGGSAMAEAIVSGVNPGALSEDPIDDTASAWNIVGDMVVGTNRLATLTVEDGAQLTSQTGAITAVSYIGYGAASDGSSATVTGTGSQWLHQHYLTVAQSGGNLASPAQLNVLDGGLVEATYIPVAGADGSYGVVNVDGPDSELRLVTNAKSGGIGDIRMVPSGSSGTAILNVTGGGLVATVSNVEVGHGDAAGTATVDVAGANSKIDVGGELSVAYDNSTGTLNISNGATVANVGDAFISRNDGNGTANVGAAEGADAGHALATWTTGTPSMAANMYISGNSITNAGANVGVLNINPTGKATVNGLLRVWDRGVVNLKGGTLEVKSLNVADSSGAIATSPDFNFTKGTLRFIDAAGATLDAAQLAGILGNSPTLVASQHLAVVGTAALTAPLRLNGGTFSVGAITPANMANLDFDAGTFNLTSANLTVGNGGIFGSSLLIDNDQVVNVTNQATIDADAELVVAGGFSSGGLTVNGDLVVIDATIGGPVVNNNNVTVVVNAEFTGLVSGPGNFYGPGTPTFSGGLAPGASPAEITFESDIAFADTNTLFIEIGGMTLGDDYDSLSIVGDAELDGLLSVSLDNFTPTPGQEFTVLTASSIVDQGLALGGPAASQFSLMVDDMNVILQAVVPTLLGDYNNDGEVNAADYTVYRNRLAGIGGTTLEYGDNTPGVGPDDYIRWRDHYGEELGDGAGTHVGTSEIPEPASVLSAVWGLLLVGLGGTKRRRRRFSC